jgi:tetratricopeptide (TPR) repeat protein
MDFGDAERRFRQLKAQLDAGQIDAAGFEVQLRQLQVVDEQGRYWMIGAQSGLWYYYDGAKWVASEPPEEGEAPRVEAPSPEPPSSPPPAPPKATRPKEGRRPSGLAVPIIGAVIALCCILSGLAVVVSEFVLPSRPLSTLVTGLIEGSPATHGTPAAMKPSPTGGVSASEYIAAGDQLFSKGRYEEAITEYQRALGLEPQNAEIYARMGQAYLQSDNCDRAIPEFQQALALDPDLETAQAGLLECGGALPPDVSFSTYSRSDLRFSLLYPSSWFVREEELQTIFAEDEQDIESLSGNVFFISSLPLDPGEEGMDSMGALVKARQLIDLPMGSQLGGVEIASFAGWEWATVQGQISGLQVPTTIYIAAAVKDSSWYGIWAIAPSETWEQVSWPIFRVMANSVQLTEVVAEASETPEMTPSVETPQATPEGSPQPTATSPAPTATTRPSGSPSPSATTPAATATPKPATLSGKIAYPRYVGGTNHYEIHIADVSGTELGVIYGGSEPALDLAGTRIVYRSWDPSYRGLVISGIGGGGKDRPRGGAEPNEDSVPRFSSDGLSLVYATKRFGPHHNSVIRTHSLQHHTEVELGLGDNPDWSNDGQYVVAKKEVLVVMSPAGGIVRQLTSNSSDASPDWSPTSNKIAFMRPTGDNWDIWAVNADGSGETRLTTADSVDGLPAWSPDGTHIAFLSNRGGTWAIWAMKADGSDQHKLFNTGCSTYATTEQFDGEWAGGESRSYRSWVDEQISWSR